MSGSIKHEVAKNYDALRFGLNGVKGEIVGSHPLETLRESVRTLAPLQKSLRSCFFRFFDRFDSIDSLELL